MKQAILLSVCCVLCRVNVLGAQESPSYAKHIRPFLAKYCLECHNPKSFKGGLDLETFKAMMEGGDKGSVLTPGKADESRLVTMIEGKRKPIMPPKTAKFQPKLDEIALVREWVAKGARDDSADIKVVIPNIAPRHGAAPPVTALAFHPQGHTLLAAKHKKITRIDPRDGLEMDSHLEPGPVTAMAFSPKGDYWAVAYGKAGTPAGVNHYVTANPYQPPRHLAELHEDAILSLAYSPDAKTLATASYDTQIRLTPLVEDGRQQIMLKEHSDAVYAVAFSPDGKLLASCSADRAMKVWEAATGKLLYTLGEATDWLYTLAWSPDGRHLASGGVDRSIRVYRVNPESGKLLHSVFAHPSPVLKLAYAKDGKTLYSLGQQGTIKSWDTERMIERKVYDPQPETVLALAVRMDRPQLVLGRYDGAVVLVDEATGKVQAQAKGRDKLPAKPQPPKVNRINPSTVKRGGRVVVTIEGQNLEGVDSAVLDKPGVTGEVLHKTKSRDKVDVEVNLGGSAAVGIYQLKLKNAAGESSSLPLTVDWFDVVSELEANNSVGMGQTMKLPISVAGSLDRAGDVDHYRFEAKKDQQLGVHIATAAVGSKVEPFLQLLDSQGRVLIESHEGFLGHRFQQDGVYALAVRDREFRGGANMHYRLHLGDIPVVISVFPLGVPRGTSRVIRLQGVHLEHDKFAAKIAANHAVGDKVVLFVDTPRGKPLGNTSVVVGEFPDVFVQKQKAQELKGVLPVPATANSELSRPGSHHLWSFQAKKGQRLVLEVDARRLGSNLDSVLEILDAGNQPVPRAVLRCQAKTFVTFRDHDSAAAGVRIEAWDELAVNDFIFVGGQLLKIQALPTHPDADCIFFNTAGQRLGFLDTTPTHLSMNLPMYKVSVHPPGSVFPPNGYPVFTLNYRNDDGGPGYGRDARILFDPPADGEYRVRISDTRGQGGVNYGYRLTVRQPRPSFNVRFNPTNPTVPKGEAIPVTVTCDRLDGYEGPISLELTNLPPGFSAPKTAIPANEFATAFALFAEPNAQTPAKSAPIKLLAQAVVDGKKIVKETTVEAPKALEAGEIITTTEQSEITLKPGGQVKLTVNIERRKGFTGRVPLDVKGLPHGVKVLDIGLNGILVTEAETRRTIAIYAEAWVEPTNHPIVVFAKREGSNAEHAARSVLLKVAR